MAPLQALSLPARQRRARIRQISRHVINQDLFRDALVRERKRADRFEESFALVLLSLNCKTGGAIRWTEVVDALTSQRLDTDLIGWFEQGSVIGLVRSLGHTEAGEAAAELAGTVRRELVRCLSGRRAAGCSIRLEVYTPHPESIPPVLHATDRRTKARELLRHGAKRTLDVTGSVGLLAVLAPAFIAIAAAVKLTSKGPVFFRQQRIGEAGRPFTMLKFRTMQVNADPSIHQQFVAAFIKAGAEASAAGSGVFKIVDDPRVTSIGHFLRRSSLDELPQFWNVLKGEMSLVGPRPPLPYEVATYKPWHRRRVLEARPGITGLWQVTGRSRTTFEDMVRLDLRYARNHSVLTDLQILLATPRAVVTGKGAH
jgi:lipopolysaccharide/colanic/teichoic acid biosynthesis glycosyltransferase